MEAEVVMIGGASVADTERLRFTSLVCPKTE
jgi:hypothetical protein